MIINQANLFLIFVINGALIGFIFDIFRILRKSFKTVDIITIIEDILFWIIAGSIILYSTFVFNNGEIRFFMFIGVVLGAGIYMVCLSQSIIKVSVIIVTALKKVVGAILKIIVFPIKSIYKITKKPILFCFINIKKTFRQIYTKIHKNKNKKIGENKNKSRILN